MKPTATPDGVPLAGLGSRLVARIIDGMLTGTVVTLATLPFIIPFAHRFGDYVREQTRIAEAGGTAVSDPFELYSETGLWVFLAQFLAISVLVSSVYTVLLIRLWGATLGKRMMGIRVRPWDHEDRPGWGQAILRWATYEGVGYLSVLVSFVGIYTLINVLWPLWDQRKQALHDKAAKTVVVATR